MNTAYKTSIYAWFLGGFLMPPAMWLFICWFSELWSTQELVQVMLSPLLALYVVSYVTTVVLILRRKLSSLERVPESSDEAGMANTQA
jgi:hypothetical protein